MRMAVRLVFLCSAAWAVWGGLAWVVTLPYR